MSPHRVSDTPREPSVKIVPGDLFTHFTLIFNSLSLPCFLLSILCVMMNYPTRKDPRGTSGRLGVLGTYTGQNRLEKTRDLYPPRRGQIASKLVFVWGYLEILGRSPPKRCVRSHSLQLVSLWFVT